MKFHPLTLLVTVLMLDDASLTDGDKLEQRDVRSAARRPARLVHHVQRPRISIRFAVYFLRQGGYSFIGFCLCVCLFVSRITQKLLKRFSQHSVERWHMGHGRNR